MEEGSPSTEVVSEANLKETTPMVLARSKTAAYKDNSTSGKFAEVVAGMETAPDLVTEEDFQSQGKKIKTCSTSGET